MNQFQQNYQLSLPILQYYTIYPLCPANYVQIPQAFLCNPMSVEPIANTSNDFNQNQLPKVGYQMQEEVPQILLPTLQELTKLHKRAPRKYWSVSQDKELLNYYNKFPKEWEKISNSLNNRNQAMCYSRYRRLSQGNKKYWSDQLDQKIIEKVQQMGFQWKNITKYIPDKTPKQIRQRYLNFLRPNILKTQWTPEQDLKICQLVLKIGRTWKKFEQYLVGRTENQIKGRYYGHLKRIMENKYKKMKKQC